MINIRRVEQIDLGDVISLVAEDQSQQFTNRDQAAEWIAATFNAYPRFQIFIAEDNGKIVGCTCWEFVGGFAAGIIRNDFVIIKNNESKEEVIQDSISAMQNYAKHNLDGRIDRVLTRDNKEVRIADIDYSTI